MNPLDSIHADEQFFGANRSYASECHCTDCATERARDRLARAELIARVALEMRVEVSLKASPGRLNAEQFKARWQAVRAAKRRQNAGRWR